MARAILVTGGSGFLGTHLVEELLRRGLPVVDYSLKAADLPPRRSGGAGAAGLAAVEGDICDETALCAAMRQGDVALVVHAAAINGEDAASRDPAAAIRTNIVGTATVVEAALRCDVRRVVNLGSATQYGVRDDRAPLPEEARSDPSGVYASTKQAAECIGARIAESRGMEFVRLRISAPYGPLEDIVPSPLHVRFWCEAALAGRAVRLDAGGDHPRDLTHVSDTARAIADICTARELAWPAYNVSSGTQVTIGEVVSIVRTLCPGADLSLGGGLLHSEDPRIASSLRGPLDITRLQRETGFRPLVGLADGIKDYLSWLAEDMRIDPVAGPHPVNG